MCIIHRKTPVLESLFDKVAVLQPINFIKKRLQHRCFPVNIEKFLKTSILKNICKWLLLLQSSYHRKITICNIVLISSVRAKIAQETYLCNVQTTFHGEIIYNFAWIYLGRSNHPDVFCKKSVLRIITTLTGKHLYQSIFFNKVAGLCKKRDSGSYRCFQ